MNALTERVLCECGCGEPAPVATQSDTSRGVVRGQQLRFAYHHNSGAALTLANDVRTWRSHLKLDLRTGRKSVAMVLADPPPQVLSMRVADLLMALPAYGRVKVSKVMRGLRMDPVVRVGVLSVDRRWELITALRAYDESLRVGRERRWRRQALAAQRAAA